MRVGPGTGLNLLAPLAPRAEASLWHLGRSGLAAGADVAAPAVVEHVAAAARVLRGDGAPGGDRLGGPRGRSRRATGPFGGHSSGTDVQKAAWDGSFWESVRLAS